MKQQAADDEGDEDAPVARAGKINLHRFNHGSASRALVPRAQHANHSQNKPENEKRRRHHPGQDADVRIGKVPEGIQHEQQEEGEQAADHDDQPGQTHPILQQGWPMWRLACFLVIHKYKNRSSCHRRNLPGSASVSFLQADNSSPGCAGIFRPALRDSFRLFLKQPILLAVSGHSPGNGCQGHLLLKRPDIRDQSLDVVV